MRLRLHLSQYPHQRRRKERCWEMGKEQNKT